jgi:hypothetical protein
MNPFFLTSEKIGPLELRPWSLTTQMAISALSECKFTESEQMCAMAWLQNQDPDEVIQAVSDGTAETKIRDFCKSFPLALIKPVSDWCERQNACIASGQVEVIPRTEGDDGPKN